MVVCGAHLAVKHQLFASCSAFVHSEHGIDSTLVVP